MVDQVQWQTVIPMFCERIWGWFVEAAFTAGLLPSADIPVEWAPPKLRERQPLAGRADRPAGDPGRLHLAAAADRQARLRPEAGARGAGRSSSSSPTGSSLVLDSDPRKVSRAGLAQANAAGRRRPAPPARRRREGTAPCRTTPSTCPSSGGRPTVRSIDEEARTVEVVWTTGATVRRAAAGSTIPYDEELSVDPGRGAARAPERRRAVPRLAPRPTGSTAIARRRRGRLGADRAAASGRATIRLSRPRRAVEPVWRDIQAGIIRNVSVGYRVHRFEIEKRDGAPELWRAVDWEPLELSAVAIGADPGAQCPLGRGRRRDRR